MSIYEVTSILEDRYLISEIVEFLSNIEKEDIRDYAIKNMVCPICYSNLVIRNYWESRGECFGFPCREEMNELLCENCDWIDE